MSDAATNFLGSGFAFPFRAGPAGLPDVQFVTGIDLVSGVVKFLLDTVPGDLPFAPDIGINPDYMRHDALDQATIDEAESNIRISLGNAEPRIRDVDVVTTRRLGAERMDTDVKFGVIDAPVGDNDVRLPKRNQQDILKVADTGRLAIQGFADSISIISGIGTTGNE